MTAWVVIGTKPQRGFYTAPSKPLSTIPDISYPLLASLGRLRRPLGIDGGEASNITIELDNGNAGLTAIAADWLFESAIVYYLDNGTSSTVISGSIQTIDISESISITIVG